MQHILQEMKNPGLLTCHAGVRLDHPIRQKATGERWGAKCLVPEGARTCVVLVAGQRIIDCLRLHTHVHKT